MMGMGKGEEQGIIPRVRGGEERTVRGEGVKGRGGSERRGMKGKRDSVRGEGEGG